MRDPAQVHVDLDGRIDGIRPGDINDLRGGARPLVIGDQEQQLTPEGGVLVIIGVLLAEFLRGDLPDQVIELSRQDLRLAVLVR